MVLSKVHALDGEISIGELEVVCNDEIELSAIINNQGETTITEVAIEVVVNGLVVDVINTTVDVPFQNQDKVEITIGNNLQQSNNNIIQAIDEDDNLQDIEIAEEPRGQQLAAVIATPDIHLNQADSMDIQRRSSRFGNNVRNVNIDFKLYH